MFAVKFVRLRGNGGGGTMSEESGGKEADAGKEHRKRTKIGEEEEDERRTPAIQPSGKSENDAAEQKGKKKTKLTYSFL